MNPPLVIHPRADLDQVECFSYLARHNPQQARRFLDAVGETLLAIEKHPDRGHRYLHAKRADEDWRYFRIAGFKKYLLFYRIMPAAIEVVRIVHGSRDLDNIFRVL